MTDEDFEEIERSLALARDLAEAFHLSVEQVINDRTSYEIWRRAKGLAK